MTPKAEQPPLPLDAQSSNRSLSMHSISHVPLTLNPLLATPLYALVSWHMGGGAWALVAARGLFSATCGHGRAPTSCKLASLMASIQSYELDPMEGSQIQWTTNQIRWKAATVGEVQISSLSLSLSLSISLFPIPFADCGQQNSRVGRSGRRRYEQ